MARQYSNNTIGLLSDANFHLSRIARHWFVIDSQCLGTYSNARGSTPDPMAIIQQLRSISATPGLLEAYSIYE